MSSLAELWLSMLLRHHHHRAVIKKTHIGIHTPNTLNTQPNEWKQSFKFNTNRNVHGTQIRTSHIAHRARTITLSWTIERESELQLKQISIYSPTWRYKFNRKTLMKRDSQHPHFIKCDCLAAWNRFRFRCARMLRTKRPYFKVRIQRPLSISRKWRKRKKCLALSYYYLTDCIFQDTGIEMRNKDQSKWNTWNDFDSSVVMNSN